MPQECADNRSPCVPYYLAASAQPLGIVRRDLDTGALAQLANGVYVQVNAQVLRSLPQQAIMQAIARAG